MCDAIGIVWHNPRQRSSIGNDGGEIMALYWISYSSDDDPKRRGRQGRERRWRWPWQWFQRGPRPVAADNRRRSQGGGERRSLWPLLLLLLLLLILAIGAFFLIDNWGDEEDTERTASSGNLDPSFAPFGRSGVPPGVIPIADTDIAPEVGGLAASIPSLPSFDIGDDATVMDLGDMSCHEERYVLMTDGKAHMIENLDDETVEALARSRTPIDTIALDADSDTTRLQTIAERTGGAFTRMER